MVRIITRLDKVRKDLAESKAASKLDFKIGSISGNLRAIIADEEMEYWNLICVKDFCLLLTRSLGNK